MVAAVTENESQITATLRSRWPEAAKTSTDQTHTNSYKRVNKRNGYRVKEKSNESKGSQKHLPAASALAAIPLCALQEGCLKSAKNTSQRLFTEDTRLSSLHNTLML